VRDVLVQNIGATVSSSAIRAAFDRAFGPGAGARVTVSCSGQGQGRQISELVISLAGDVTGSAPVGDLIQAAAPVPPGCPSGLVDRSVH
jgi:ribonuclease T2